MNKIAFICDTACDIDSDFARENNVFTIPFSINFEKKSYLDGIDITREKIYTMMEKEIPTTSVCSANIIIDTLTKIREDGIKNVIMASISSKLSGMHNLFRMCAEGFEGLNIELVDTGLVTIGAGFPIIKGIKAYKEGADFQEVVKTMKEASKNVFEYVYFRDLTNIVKGGRIPKGKAYLAKLLNIKPIMTVKNGVMVEAKKVRSNRHAIKFFRESFDKYVDGAFYISSIYANNEDDCKKIEEEFKEEFERANYRQRTNVTPTVSVHSGTEFLALAFMIDK